ncbi:MAG: replication initiation factor domain-containing protein [Anoxybacillus sp.]|nr:replication initiation factor domain-containing protein [Anoxybacillus sp.]MCL6587674.1 replication initiation factor domain-containing protein [Anoxybacillus sp.]
MEFPVEKMCPRICSTGAQNTYSSDLIACVDWFQATLKNVQVLQDVFDIFGLEISSFALIERGLYGYRKQYRFGGIAIFFDPPDERMGVHIQMSGEGCRQYEMLTSRDWQYTFSLLLNFDISISRLDLALDDFKGFFTLEKVVSKLKRAHVTSKFKTARHFQEIRISDGSTAGQTVYFGDSSSRLQIRMYDKKQQMIAKRGECDKDFWLRTELQLRDERAHSAFEMIAFGQNVGFLASGILKNYISFRVPSSDSNKSRWDVCDWWHSFLGDVEKIKLTMKHPSSSIQRSYDWFKKQVSPTFYVLLEAFDYDFDLLFDFLLDGRSRITVKHEDMLQRFDYDDLMFLKKKIRSQVYSSVNENQYFLDKMKKKLNEKRKRLKKNNAR